MNLTKQTTFAVLILLFGGGLLADVPQAALAGVLLFVAQRLLHWQVFANVYRQAPV